MEEGSRCSFPFEKIFKRTVETCSGAVFGLASFVLLSWAVDHWKIGTLSSEYVPMAPSTAILFLLIGSSVFSFSKWPSSYFSKRLISFSVVIVILWSLLVIVQGLLGIEISGENLLISTDVKVKKIPIARMSVLTATAFLFAGFAMWFGFSDLNKRRSLRQIASFLAFSVFLIGLVVLLSYAAGAPILYGGEIVPMAFLTGLCFSLTGLAILIGNGFDIFPFSILNAGFTVFPSTQSSPFKGPIAAFLLISFSIGIPGFFFLKNQIEVSRKASQCELLATVDSKVSQISSWSRQRQVNAEVIFNTPIIQTYILDFLADASTNQTRQDLKVWLENQQKHFFFSRVVLFDSSGFPRFCAPSDVDVSGIVFNPRLAETLSSKGILFSEFFFGNGLSNGEEKTIRLNSWIPIGAKPEYGCPAGGALLMQTDPCDFLYSLSKTWPTPRNSEEMLLFIPGGDDNAFFCEISFQSAGKILAKKMPIDTGNNFYNAIVKVSKEGIFKGHDFRNIPVLAAIRNIPGTSWILVVKADQEEVFSNLLNSALIIGVLLFVLILVATLSVGLFLYQGDVKHLKELIFFENARQELADRVLHLTKHANDPIILSDLDWNILEVNDKAVKVYGFSTEEFLKMNIRDLYFGESISEFDNHSLLVRSQESTILETTHRRKNGSNFPIENSVRGVEIGGKLFFLSIIRDITERKRAEAMILSEKECLLVTLRSIGDGVITTDFYGTITLMNKVAESLTGWNDEEALEKPLQEVLKLFEETSRKECANPVIQVLESGGIVEFPDHPILINRVGAERKINISAAPIGDKDKNIRGVVLVFRDVTEKLKMEGALRNADKLQSLGVLAGGIAHDFNNLLGGIFGCVELAKKNFEAKEYSKTQSNLLKALTVFPRARDLTRQLLTFAKGGNPITKKTSLISIVQHASQFALSGSNIHVEFRFSENMYFSEVDENQFAQVIDNIILNARDAMPSGGTITISGQNLQDASTLPPELKKGNYVRISIQDTGSGIPKENRSRVFDPFFTTKKQGNGLGLATSYSIMKQHGGLVTFESELGKGTTFFLFLPGLEIAESTPNGKDAFDFKCDSKVLVMDDEETLITACSGMLKSLGCRVECVSEGDEAIEVYQKSGKSGDPFDLVILDLTIPGGKGGKETVSELLKLNPSLVAIATSGYSDDPVLANPTDFGFSARMTKPFRENDLANVLKSLTKK